MRGFFITGIGTGVGKTVVSAVLAEKFRANYWKPIQCGNLNVSDSDVVKSLTSRVSIQKEIHCFRLAASPHLAASEEGISIQISKMQLPKVNGTFIVEGAGGVCVPLNSKHTMLDLAKRLRLPLILVSRHYLGSINHTLLSIKAIRSERLSLLGVVFVGRENPSTERIIEQMGKVKILRRIPEIEKVTKKFVVAQGRRWKWQA